jgi:hypothetical protein
VPSDVDITRHATAAHLLGKGQMSRLATSPTAQICSSQPIIMGFSSNMAASSCIAVGAYAFHATPGMA